MTVLGRKHQNYVLEDMYPYSFDYNGAFILAGGTSIGTQAASLYTQYIPQFGGGYITLPTPNVFTQIINISGSGYLMFVISGAPYPGGSVETARVTIDGQTRDIGAYNAQDDRAIFIFDRIETNGASDLYSSPEMLGNWNYVVGQTTPFGPARAPYLPGPSSGPMRGMRFENQCKVEIRSTAGYYNGLGYQYAAAAVFLDQ